MQLTLKDLPVISITLVLVAVMPLLGVKWKVNLDQGGAKDCCIECRLRTRATAMVLTTLLAPILVPMGSVLLQVNSRDTAHFSTKGNTHVVLLMGVWSHPLGPVIILAWTMLRTPRLCNHRFCQFEVE